ncbi:hypothetical protein KFE94_02455 [bacterium SCSIO 12643]|nr:hypothetical protein KFE94_02455 [bacterium SCSIO 12643]
MIERRNGIQRDKRLNGNLLDSPFQIDQRPFWHLLGYISSLLKHINYYDLNNEHDGQWNEVIKSDPIILMVHIINEPVDRLTKIIQDNELQLSTDNILKKEVVGILIKWYDKIESWYHHLLSHGEEKLAYKIKNVLVDVLELQKEHLITYQNQINPKGAFVQKLSSPGPSDDDTPFSLEKSLHNFTKVIIHIQEFTKDYLEKNIYSNNDLTPNNALYVAFSLLFRTAQNHINTLSQRHLDFYYSDILKQSIGKGRSTSTIVNFELLPDIEYSLVDKGVQLSAGKLFGSKSDILFETEKPLIVYQMELVELQTLLFESNPYIKVGTDQPLVSSITQNTLISKGEEASSKDQWYTFGANKRSIRNTQIQANSIAEMGFIIGSSVLILQEGNRHIRLQFNLQKSDQPNTFWTLLNEIKENRKIAMDTVFSDVFDNGFNISYSSKSGWESIPEYVMEYNETSGSFSILLFLDSAAPAVTTSEKISPTLTWPSIKVELNPYAPNYLYSFFRGVDLNSIRIDVEVEQMKDLMLYNNIGKMPLNKTFDLFGPIPEKGAFLMIGNPELFQKQINSLTVNIDWSNLPDDFGGFESYYKGYSTAFNNDSFQVQFSALSNGYWLPNVEPEIPVFNLFDTINCVTPEGYSSTKLKSTTQINLQDFGDLGIAQNFNIPLPLAYDITSQSGFIKFTLSSPSVGFGNDLYQKEFIDIATFNAKNKTQIPYPNKPYLPKVNSVSVNYKASDTLYFTESLSKSSASVENTGSFQHITPFGITDVISGHQINSQTLLANYSAEGYLILGLNGVKEDTFISVYFHFLHSSTSTQIDPNGLTWEYRQQNEWIEFNQGNIVLDETNGFIKSGIVELILPKKKNYNETTSNATYWIRISTAQNAPHYPIIKGIYLNAIKATCIDLTPNVVGQTIPAGSITKLVGKHPDIKKVNQPRNSLGGKVTESATQYYTRVSERLRHKSRAVTIWDYERLILENFDEVQIVKCTNFNKNFQSVPQQVKVIVISSRWTNSERHYFNEDALDQMKMFLRKLTNPFVNITVMNPTVEYLLVNCIVEFMPEDNGGYYIHQLNQHITDFLSPISNSNTGIGGIGGTVVPTMVVSSIDNLSFIKSIKKLTIEHIIRTDIETFTLGVYQGGQEIQSTTPWAILAPMQNHRIISQLPGQKSTNDLDVGICNMQIGVDFILESEAEITQHSGSPPSTSSHQNGGDLTDSILVFKDKSQQS